MIYYPFIALAMLIFFGWYKNKYLPDAPFWPTKHDFIMYAIFGAGISAIEVFGGFVAAPWAIQFAATLLMTIVCAILVSCIAWAIGKLRGYMLLYTQRCPQCDSKEVINEEFMDIFDYGCDNGLQARLAVETVKHICCNCGFEYTGYQAEQDRAKAVKNYLNR